MYICKFGQNPSTDSEGNAQKRSNVNAKGICTENNTSPLPSVGVHSHSKISRDIEQIRNSSVNSMTLKFDLNLEFA